MSEARTLHRSGESRVCSWVQKETWGYKSGLELGCGVGAYTREMLCLVRAGIDAFEPYISEAKETPENTGIEFIVGDMLRFPWYISRNYQLGMMIDSIEHVTKDEGIELVQRCKSHFDKLVLFVPIGKHEQEPCDGNEMQRHLSTWYPDDLAGLQFNFHVKDDFHNSNPIGSQAAAFATWTRV